LLYRAANLATTLKLSVFIIFSPTFQSCAVDFVVVVVGGGGGGCGGCGGCVVASYE
jgi:hypothetical protein